MRLCLRSVVTVLGGPSVLVAGLLLPAPARAAAPPLSFTAYVSAGNRVVPVDTVTGRRGPVIALPARALAITPDGRTLLVAAAAGTLTPVSTATHAIGRPVDVGGRGSPADVAVAPDGRTAWVSTSGGTVVPVDLATGTAGTPVDVGTHGDGIALTPDGATAYVVTEFDPGTVVPLDTATRLAGPPIVVGNVPRGIAVTPDGRTVWVANTGQVWPIDTASRTAGRPIDGGDLLNQIAITPGGTKAYVTDDRAGQWSVFDLATGRKTATFDGGSYGVAFTPDGRTALVADQTAVVMVDARADLPTRRLAFPTGVGDITITPAQAPTAAFTVTPRAAGALTRFDGSGSVRGTGPVVRWAWRFGDGTQATTTSPVVGHAYLAPGGYTVRLTVTDAAGTSTGLVFTGQTASRHGGPSATTTHWVRVPR